MGGATPGIAWRRAYRRTSGEGMSVVGLLLRRCFSSWRRSRETRACPGVKCFQRWHRVNLSPESTLLVARCVKGLVLVSEGKILRFELAELLGALLQLLGVFVGFFLQDLKLQGQLGIGLFVARRARPPPLSRSLDYSPPSSAKLLGDFCVGSFLPKAGLSRLEQVKLFHILKYGRFSLSEVFHFPEEGGDPGTGPGKLNSGEPGFLLAGILGNGVPSSGDPEAGVLPGEIMNNNLLASDELLRLRAKEVELRTEFDVTAVSDFSVGRLDLP
ncbi:hypothetical protein F2Q69_00058672 [Brassica cretica]|uniref:Uncharacterized protein n=1 Tax=Brassica cretica TaxID=69181 RepID=A0A8S9RMY3_BRACR|nr:hypothetical protein F2Q69_00058672 [Brassica cretica]